MMYDTPSHEEVGSELTCTQHLIPRALGYMLRFLHTVAYIKFNILR